MSSNACTVCLIRPCDTGDTACDTCCSSADSARVNPGGRFVLTWKPATIQRLRAEAQQEVACAEAYRAHLARLSADRERWRLHRLEIDRWRSGWGGASQVTP